MQNIDNLGVKSILEQLRFEFSTNKAEQTKFADLLNQFRSYNIQFAREANTEKEKAKKVSSIKEIVNENKGIEQHGNHPKWTKNRKIEKFRRGKGTKHPIR